MDGVREERTGWRCQKISARHRTWGWNCPVVDLDFVVLEYNYGEPVALIEYKEEHAAAQNVDHPTYKALIRLADGYKDGPLPCLIARYNTTHWWFEVTPLNDAAKEFYGPVVGQKIAECRFVKSLYLLRKKTLSDMDIAAIARLNTEEPENNRKATP